MKWFLRAVVVLILVAAALPFAFLSAIGVMRPTEGFCVEDIPLESLSRLDLGAPPTAQELEQSFFVWPELADTTMRVPLIDQALGFEYWEEGLNWRWPVCIRSRRAVHRMMQGLIQPELLELGEPNLVHQVQDGSVYRVVTSPSFSRVPIAFRLNVPSSGAAVLSSAWLEDDGTKPDPAKRTVEGDLAWRNASLPRRTFQRTLTAQQAKALQMLFDDLPPYQSFNLDGVVFGIEAVHDGRRDARGAFLFPPPDATGLLFCALATQSGIPAKVLEDGHVNHCASPNDTSGP